MASPSSPSSASTVGSPPATDPDDDLLDGTGTTRLRPHRVLSPRGPEAARTTRGKGPSGRSHEEPPISAQVLRNHQGLTPTGPPSGTDEDTRPFRPSHNDEGFSDPDDTVRLQPRSVRPAPSSLKGGAPSPAPDTLNDGPSPRPEAAPRPPRSPAPPLTGVQGATDRTRLGHGARVPDRPTSSTTAHGPAARKWLGHRPLREQPGEYRRPSWPAGPPSGDRRSTASADWPDRDPEDTVTVPGPAPGTAQERRSPEPQGSPWLDPDDEEILKERRPPSGYVEFDTDEAADAPMNRLTRWWGPNATLSKRAVVALFVLGAASVVAALLFLRREPEEVEAPEMVSQATPGSGDTDGEASEEAAEPGADEDVVVHVGGDVEDPGLYTLPAGARVLDAVEEAGGALPDADLDLVNLARPVVDGERVLLGAEVAAEGAEGEDGQADHRVSLNQADGSALETLPGIGEAKADAILEHRESLGGSFSSVEELMDVSGIGQSTFDNLEEQVML